MHHVLESQQFDRPLLEDLFKRADELRGMMEAGERAKLQQVLQGKLLFNVFYEPSTRTRFSFAAGASHMGMNVVATENASQFSSAIKGETLEDSIRVLCQCLPDIIVLRHPEKGAAKRAASVSTVPIINAGDGAGQHPTQALLDIYTIKRELSRTDDITIIIGGDLAHGRTARSLAYLLTKFESVKVIFVSPPQLKIGDDIKEYLHKKGTYFEEQENLESTISKADVVYWTRVQKERIKDDKLYRKVCNLYTIGASHMERMKGKAALLHPLPRINEIERCVDNDPRAAYFRQAANGVFIRMALLEWIVR